ncbi:MULTISPECIES: tyrosine-type recombinase/integrase [Hydrogenophaga]|uniref:tyrosine-type recombinase/integrase n=1 Tax=Hydrogenophaga TaxID=47420 RepID=UPI0008244F4B|nr:MULTISPECIES: integrase family protein [Hydrogenophaga]
MARPKKTDLPDTAQAIELTAGAIARLSCRSDTKAQAFLRDTKAPGLRVRVTNTGSKSFVFERKLASRTIRLTIGDVRTWSIEQARAEARRLAVVLDAGQDPREIERQKQAAVAAEKAATIAQAATVGEAWAVYLDARRSHWGDLHLRDNVSMMAPGGEPKKRGKGTTEPGPLHHFASLRLVDLTADTVQAWAAREAHSRPTRARLGLHLFHAFLCWCTEHPEYAALIPEKNPARNRRAREALGKPKAKRDALLKEQLPAWFAAVQGLRSPAVSAYLQTLLLTGARPGELLALRWDDVNTQWRGLTIRDKDASKGGQDGTRRIPMTPYVWYLLASLPRRNEWVFSSDTKSQPISRPHRRLADACAVAGIAELTLHGLRRSFGTLSEWLELPAGVVAQIQGHKPSATAEKHYRVRPLDLLRVHHERLEAWTLEQAGIKFDPRAQPEKLQVVAA